MAINAKKENVFNTKGVIWVHYRIKITHHLALCLLKVMDTGFVFVDNILPETVNINKKGYFSKIVLLKIIKGVYDVEGYFFLLP